MPPAIAPPQQGILEVANIAAPCLLTKDAEKLARLVSYLSPEHGIPYSLLYRGGSPRLQWSVHGDSRAVKATHMGLSEELTNLLSNGATLRAALDSLLATGLVHSDDDAYKLNKEVASSIRENTAACDSEFWKCQALIVASRAIPWKYLEPRSVLHTNLTLCLLTPPRNLNVSLLVSHLQYTVQSTHIDSVSRDGRVDLVLTLLEAARFAPMAWKRIAVARANAAMCGLEDARLSSCIATTQSVMRRFDGVQAEQPGQTLDAFSDEPTNPGDRRSNACRGLLVIQRSLDCIQVEELSQAAQILHKWNPLSLIAPSLMEQTVLFRKNLLLGKVLRYQGHFKQAHQHLQEALALTKRPQVDLTFDEDLRDLTCELADTLRELNEPCAAEVLLREQLARMDEHVPGSAMPGRSLLQASLAEALFAQGQMGEAEQLCLQARSSRNIMKLGTLRFAITLAKIAHMADKPRAAQQFWSEALAAISKFPLTNGRTTRIILLSAHEVLPENQVDQIRQQSVEQVKHLEELARPTGGTHYWIAGIRHWESHLEARNIRSRI